jgi:uncharacterized membrane protein (UPF0127 family)
VRAINNTRHEILVERGQVADTLWSKLRGLLGHAPLESGEGLLLKGENAIHTVGMSFAIDVLFLDRKGRVVHMMQGLPPMRASPMIWRGRDVLELPSGKINETGTVPGDQIEIVPNP